MGLKPTLNPADSVLFLYSGSSKLSEHLSFYPLKEPFYSLLKMRFFSTFYKNIRWRMVELKVWNFFLFFFFLRMEFLYHRIADV